MVERQDSVHDICSGLGNAYSQNSVNPNTTLQPSSAVFLIPWWGDTLMAIVASAQAVACLHRQQQMHVSIPWICACILPVPVPGFQPWCSNKQAPRQLTRGLFDQHVNPRERLGVTGSKTRSARYQKRAKTLPGAWAL